MSCYIKYYTEYLPRISSVVVSIEILNHLAHIADIALVSPLELVLKFSDGHNDSIKLSHAVYHPYNKIAKSFLQFSPDDNCYTLKLKCMDKIEEINSRSQNYFMSFNDHYRWNAKYLNSMRKNDTEFKICCLNCRNEIINSSDINRMNELPSEIWSDMMDFWHCHKPHENGEHQEVDANKYSVLRPSQNSINIGLYYFSLNNGDAFNTGLNIDTETIDFEKNSNPVQCSKCEHVLGALDFKTNLIKLNKWNFKLIQSDKEEIFNPYSFAYSLIIDSINSSASRVFQVVNNNKIYGKTPYNGTVPNVLYIWVFNSGITASVTGLNLLEDCLKIYYSTSWEVLESERRVTNKRSFKNEIESEEIELQSDVMADLFEMLQRSNKNLPKNCKTMGKWELGLLPFEWKQ
ncbi:putative polyadenylation protein [Saccharomycopsis crataegensis]|uniref:Polyadenylation protein n=1 Tax=Saccharomycopsis crataegensis TaxID=43959 RepID=A0AAV5QN77_9ASCO|nr:putative polyadenylation protein [Saccharomycopsis crataegensis]